jgi:hypothetical protein
MVKSYLLESDDLNARERRVRSLAGSQKNELFKAAVVVK